MPESEALREQRKHREQMIQSANDDLILILSKVALSGREHEDITRWLSALYREWRHDFSQENMKWITEQLERAGVKCRVHHTPSISFGDNFPAEYHISHGSVAVMGPTFDMALLDFIQQLIKQDHAMLKDMRDFMNGTFPGQDERSDAIRKKLLERTASITGEEETSPDANRHL